MPQRGSIWTAIVLAVFFASPVWADIDQDEEMLEEKYEHGDYGFYFAWHDPWDIQFDQRSFGEVEEGSYAYPIGIKVRFRMPKKFLLEGDGSYYRREEDVAAFVSTLAAPKFDGLMVALTAQRMLREKGLVRPYAGAGAVFVSLSRDFVIAIPGPDSTSVDRYQIGGWTELDVGLQAVGGVDFRLGKRLFPFLEYRHLFGELGIEKISVGGFDFSPDEIGVPLEDGSLTPAPTKYDYSGPMVMIGLKIHF
jgi:hypothetical protein